MKTIIKTILCICILSISLPSAAQDSKDSTKVRKARADTVRAEEFTDAYLDTVNVGKTFKLNDYSMIGVEYGGSGNRMMFNPPKTQTTLYLLDTYGIYYIRCYKLFDGSPVIGSKIGLRYSHEGYKFKENKETGLTPDIEGAKQAVMEVVELPFMLHLHTDGPNYMVAADAGIYGGYRLSIERTGDYVRDAIAHSFLETDRRFDYGLNAGIGFGIVVSPFEFHVNANVRWSWNSIYDPDYYSKDYFRFAYPFDVIVTAGVYYHLSRRTGKNRAQLRQEAYEQVYHPKTNEDNNGQGR